MTISHRVLIFPDPDDYIGSWSTIGRPSSPEALRARELYRASVLRRVEARRKRKAAARRAQDDATS